jgi:diguanylate cyclase (GGDEF)-like protein
MRFVTGWRFFAFIVVPLLVASVCAISLYFDLLNRVASDSNAAEQQRNQLVLSEAMQFQSNELARLVQENAHWNDAARNVVDTFNVDWFDQTWGKSISLGVAYDAVAVFDLKTGQVLRGSAVGMPATGTTDFLGDRSLASFEQLLASNTNARGIVTGFIQTQHGPRVIAMSEIRTSPYDGKQGSKVLYFSRSINAAFLGSLKRQLLIEGLSVSQSAVDQATGLTLKSPDGSLAFSLQWTNRDLGEIITASSWTKAGSVLALLILVLAGIGVVCWRLVSQLAEDEGKAQHNAMHDHLTGLPNRAAMMQAMQECETQKQPYALAFADLDGFKEVNDSYGHDIGDRLVHMIANGVRQLGKNAKLCSRLGGDEFVILFNGETALEKAKEFSANLIAMLKMPFDIDGRLASVGVSIGLAQSDALSDVTEMLRRSDIAMYKAKTSGKNRFCEFEEKFDTERLENASIASELQSILASRNLDIVFQPVVSAKTGKMTGVEALARWPLSSARRVTADKFIYIAESSGMIDALGELILERACVAAAPWKKLRLAVNISAVQLNNPGFVKRSLETIRRFGIEPNRIEFEITETTLINDTERAKQVFKELQQAGIKVALDDFGTGFSSIGYLRTFHFDRIKIDKSIVSKVLTSPKELAVLQGTLLVARGLSAEVTAEGVESKEQASVLYLAGCSELQGYLYHQPLTALEVSTLLQKVGAENVPRTTIGA